MGPDSHHPAVGVRHHGRMLSNFAPGNYRSLTVPGRPFSDGIVADPGFDLVRAVLHRPLPLYEGLEAAGRHVEGLGRPVQFQIDPPHLQQRHRIFGFALKHKF